MNRLPNFASLAACWASCWSRWLRLAQAGEWVSLFDGQTLSGWTQGGGNEDSKWEVVDGVITGSGRRSMLYSPKGDYKNFHFRAEVKINDHGNSGMYFRCPKPNGELSKGYEAQIDSTHRDPIRTGSVYGFVHVYKQLVPPDTWFTYEVEVRRQELAGQDRAAHQGVGQRRGALRVDRIHQGLGPGPFRLPAARPGQQGRRSARSRSWSWMRRGSRQSRRPIECSGGRVPPRSTWPRPAAIRET